MNSPQDQASIERFVRETLGCACPAEVFRSISIDRKAEGFEDLTPGCLIAVGGRLLVLVVEAKDHQSLVPRLAGLFARGRSTRDARGFNRFRLAVGTTGADSAREALTRRFEELANIDDRLHLHVLDRRMLPAAARHDGATGGDPEAGGAGRSN